MKRGSDVAAIHAAELRVGQSGRDARDSLLRARVILGANLARPSVLALAVGAGGLLGFLLHRRPYALAGPPPARTHVVRAAPAAGLLAAVIRRYGLRYLPSVFRLIQPAAAPSVIKQSKRG